MKGILSTTSLESTATGAKALARSLREMSAWVTYGSPSVDTWRRACDASLRASQQRRAQARQDRTTWQDILFRGVVLFAFVCVVFIIAVVAGSFAPIR